jgi:hypothetical protein
LGWTPLQPKQKEPTVTLTDQTTNSPRRRTGRRLLLIAIIPALAVAWWLGSPLFLDREVDEEFPAVETAQPPVTTTTPSTIAPAGDASTTAPPTTVPSTTTTTVAGPVELASGTFEGFDAVHQGTGSATLYDVDGSVVLRFEAFEVTNGPDLRVNLVLADGSMVDLGALKGNVGDQNYDVPSDVDLDQVDSVLIYCRAFSVEFAQAAL